LCRLRHGAPEHIHHREDEAFYILEGEFEIECGGEVFKSASGHIRAATEGSSSPIPELVGHTGQGFVRAVF
jgi:uncharacterized cupin superfamily protein